MRSVSSRAAAISDPVAIGAALLWPVAVFAAPMLVLPLTVFLVVWLLKPRSGLALAAATGVAVTLFNITKLRESDLLDYQRILADAALSDFGAYVSRTNFGSIREHEYLFKVLAWGLAHFTPSPDSALIVIATLGIYGASTYLIKAVEATTRRGSPTLFAPGGAVIAASLLAGITFSLTAHLIRQYMAASIIAVAIGLYVRGHTRWAWACIIVSPLMHQSSALILGLFFGATTLLNSRNRALAAGKLVIAAAVAAFGALALAQEYFMESAEKFATDEGSLSPALFLLDGLLCLWAGWHLRRRVRMADRGPIGVAFAVPLFILILSGALFSFPFLALRMYFYIEPFRPLLIAFAAAFAMQRMSPAVRPPALALLVAATLAFFLYRASQAPWQYVAPLPRAVLLPMPTFMS